MSRKKRRNRKTPAITSQTPANAQPQTFAQALNSMSISKATNPPATTTVPTKVYGGGVGYKSALFKKCHNGPIEVHKGLFLGSFYESLDMVKSPHNVKRACTAQ